MSIASYRQSRTVWRVSGWSGISQRAGDVLLAPDLLREDRRQQVIGAASAGSAAAPSCPRVLRGTASARVRVPAPARREQRRVQDRLLDSLPHVARAHERERVFEREAVLRPQRQHDRIVGRRRLQLEVEVHAEPLAQRQAEGAVDAPAERRVHDHLHAAGVVEEALEHDVLLRRHDAQRAALRGNVADELRCARGIDARTRPSPTSPYAIAPSRRGAATMSLRRRLTSSDSSHVRAGASPSQNGRLGGRPCASSTRTTPRVDSMRRMRHECVPSRKMSPAMLSIAQSSFTVPTNVSSGSSTTR